MYKFVIIHDYNSPSYYLILTQYNSKYHSITASSSKNDDICYFFLSFFVTKPQFVRYIVESSSKRGDNETINNE